MRTYLQPIIQVPISPLQGQFLPEDQTIPDTQDYTLREALAEVMLKIGMGSPCLFNALLDARINPMSVNGHYQLEWPMELAEFAEECEESTINAQLILMRLLGARYKLKCVFVDRPQGFALEMLVGYEDDRECSCERCSVELN